VVANIAVPPGRTRSREFRAAREAAGPSIVSVEIIFGSPPGGRASASRLGPLCGAFKRSGDRAAKVV
jgi:hypothetical protein